MLTTTLATAALMLLVSVATSWTVSGASPDCFHVIVNDEDYGQLVQDTGAMTLVVICLVVLAISAVTWLFFRLRRAGEET